MALLGDELRPELQQLVQLIPSIVAKAGPERTAAILQLLLSDALVSLREAPGWEEAKYQQAIEQIGARLSHIP